MLTVWQSVLHPDIHTDHSNLFSCLSQSPHTAVVASFYILLAEIFETEALYTLLYYH